MTPTSRTVLLLALASALLVTAGCAKKAPAPPAAPPAATSPSTPSPTTPPETVPTPTPPSMPNPPGAEATIAELKTVYFPLDSYTLDDAARSTLDANAKLLRERADVSVRVEGHCDERGTVEYNLSLGEKRAAAVRDYLVDAGVGMNRLVTISYGKERPAVDGHDESFWAKNRRAEFSKP